MMGSCQCFHLVWFTVLNVVSFCLCWDDNYPIHVGMVPRPCIQKKYTVRYEAYICIPSGDKSQFTEESVAACEDFLEECPEFNQAHCIWVEHSCNGFTVKFPSCRLKYYGARRLKTPFTWVEVVYGNQFGTGTTLKTDHPPILELRRYIKYDEFIKDKVQNPYPDSVPDPQGVQGLKWLPFKDIKDFVKYYDTNYVNESLTKISDIDPKLLCANGKDEVGETGRKLCGTSVSKFFDFIVQYRGRTAVMLESYGGIDLKSETYCGKYVMDKSTLLDVCRSSFQLKNSDTCTLPYTQRVLEIQAYVKDNAVQFRWAVLGGNSIKPDRSFIDR